MTFSALCLGLLAWWLVVVPAFAWQSIAVVGVIVFLVVWIIIAVLPLIPRAKLN